MTEIVSLWIWIIIIPIIFVALMPLLNMVFTDDVVNFINNMIWNIDYFIGSRNTNILLIIITLIMFIKVIKRIIKIIHWHD